MIYGLLEMKIITLGLLLSLCCASSTQLFAYASSEALNKKNIVGTWHCRLESPQLRYQAAMTYSGNHSFSDNGTVHQLVNGNWVTLNYQGSGRWGFGASQQLNISNYRTSYIHSPHMTDMQLSEQDISLAKHHSAAAKIIRLGSQMLVYQLPNQLGSPTARCTKRT